MRILGTIADRALGLVVPRASAAASQCETLITYCYCSGGIAYRHRCLYCNGLPVACGSCYASGTC